jgi:hypothetical protein
VSRLLTTLARGAIALYPRAWRSRYGAELLHLAEDSGLRPADVLDLAAGAIGQHLHRLRKGRPMDSRMNLVVACAAAVTAVALGLPTAVFIALNLGGTSVEWSPWLTSILPALPLVALAVALSPAVGIRASRDDDGTGAVTVRLRSMPWWLVAVAAACALLVAAVLAFGITDALREARP